MTEAELMLERARLLNELAKIRTLPQADRLLTAAQAATMIGCSTSKVRALVKRGELKTTTVAGSQYFHPGDVADYILGH